MRVSKGLFGYEPKQVDRYCSLLELEHANILNRMAKLTMTFGFEQRVLESRIMKRKAELEQLINAEQQLLGMIEPTEEQ